MKNSRRLVLCMLVFAVALAVHGYRHWVAKGLSAFEAQLAGNDATGSFCHGDHPGLADICLVPQIFNAKRLDCPLDDYPVTMEIFGRCMEVEAFEAATPANQPDAA